MADHNNTNTETNKFSHKVSYTGSRYEKLEYGRLPAIYNYR